MEEKDYLREIVALNTELINAQRMLEKQNQVLQEKNIELEKAFSEIKILKRLLPICIKCKKIRNDDGYWTEIESYFHQHSDVDFSHGYCEICFREEYPEYADKILNEIENEKKLK